MIPVTKTFLPDLNEYQKWVQMAFDNNWLTNRGPLVLELEDKLKSHLEIGWVTLTNNGTIPLQIALKILAKEGEVITTPFSYVATTAAIVWENCTPVFVDIDPKHLTIDETKIEAAITPKTTCILATHVFGNPCNIEAIEKIAKKHNLAVIYDAAHCFDVKYKNKSIFDFGDVSTCSFHATKLFHTGEGGAMFCKDKQLQQKLYYSHNFGHDGPLDFHGLGINAKMSELHAAMGLSVLPEMKIIETTRKEVAELYNKNIDFTRYRKLTIREGTDWNFSYYPIIFNSEKELLETEAKLNKQNIFPRRYFNPSLNTIKYTGEYKKMTTSESIASRILCLPLYVGLKKNDIQTICNILNDLK